MATAPSRRVFGSSDHGEAYDFSDEVKSDSHSDVYMSDDSVGSSISCQSRQSDQTYRSSSSSSSAAPFPGPRKRGRPRKNVTPVAKDFNKQTPRSSNRISGNSRSRPSRLGTPARSYKNDPPASDNSLLGVRNLFSVSEDIERDLQTQFPGILPKNEKSASKRTPVRTARKIFEEDDYMKRLRSIHELYATQNDENDGRAKISSSVSFAKSNTHDTNGPSKKSDADKQKTPYSTTTANSTMGSSASSSKKPTADTCGTSFTKTTPIISQSEYEFLWQNVHPTERQDAFHAPSEDVNNSASTSYTIKSSQTHRNSDSCSEQAQTSEFDARQCGVNLPKKDHDPTPPGTQDQKLSASEWINKNERLIRDTLKNNEKNDDDLIAAKDLEEMEKATKTIQYEYRDDIFPEIKFTEQTLDRMIFKPPVAGERYRLWHCVIPVVLDVNKDRFRSFTSKTELGEMVIKTLAEYNAALDKRCQYSTEKLQAAIFSEIGPKTLYDDSGIDDELQHSKFEINSDMTSREFSEQYPKAKMHYHIIIKYSGVKGVRSSHNWQKV